MVTHHLQTEAAAETTVGPEGGEIKDAKYATDLEDAYALFKSRYPLYVQNYLLLRWKKARMHSQSNYASGLQSRG